MIRLLVMLQPRFYFVELRPKNGMAWKAKAPMALMIRLLVMLQPRFYFVELRPKNGMAWKAKAPMPRLRFRRNTANLHYCL